MITDRQDITKMLKDMLNTSTMKTTTNNFLLQPMYTTVVPKLSSGPDRLHSYGVDGLSTEKNDKCLSFSLRKHLLRLLIGSVLLRHFQ